MGYSARAWQCSGPRWSRIGQVMLAVCLLGGVSLGSGCTSGTIGYLLGMAYPNNDPEMFTFTKHKKNPKVAFLVCQANPPYHANTDLLNTDQLLAQRLVQVLSGFYQSNRDKIQIVPLAKVEQFKSQHPSDWKTMSPDELGRQLGADYVVNVDISKLSLVESGLLFRGRAEINISVVDVHDVAEGKQKIYTCEYPSHGPVYNSECTPEAFRSRFVDKMSLDLGRWFASYPREMRYQFD
jgi:hypothetical protein